MVTHKGESGGGWVPADLPTPKWPKNNWRFFSPTVFSIQNCFPNPKKGQLVTLLPFFFRIKMAKIWPAPRRKHHVHPLAIPHPRERYSGQVGGGWQPKYSLQKVSPDRSARSRDPALSGREFDRSQAGPVSGASDSFLGET